MTKNTSGSLQPLSRDQYSYLQRLLSSLRAKIILALLVVLLFLLLLNALLVQRFMLPSFEHVEEQRILVDLGRIEQSLKSSVEQIDGVNQAWSSWDGTYSFMETFDKGFADRNLSDGFFQQYDINILVIANTSQQVVYSKSYDHASQISTSAPPDLERYLLSHPSLLQFEQLNSGHSGIILIPQGALLVSLRPILNDLGEGPSRGTLLMGRTLDAEKIAALGKLIELNFGVSALDLPNDTLQAIQTSQISISADQKALVQPLNDSTIMGYGLIHDIVEQPIVLLRVEQARDIFLVGQQQSRYLSLALAIGGLLIGMAIVLLIEQLFLRRLLNLDTQVEQIGRSNDLVGRVHIVGQDELSHLCQSINTMLDAQAHTIQERLQLEEARIHILERESILRKTLQEVSTPIIPVLVDTFVIPLLGSFNDERIDNLVQVVLSEVYKQHAKHVIFDFTAIQLPDSNSMQRIIQLGDAISLLGARIMLVGIRAEVAQALVQFGINLEDKDIAADLQTAVRALTAQPVSPKSSGLVSE